jgi:hypothetical protein
MSNKIVFKSSIAKILITVLFLKIMLIMDFDDILFVNLFSLLFYLPQTRVADWLKIAALGAPASQEGIHS